MWLLLLITTVHISVKYEYHCDQMTDDIIKTRSPRSRLVHCQCHHHSNTVRLVEGAEQSDSKMVMHLQGCQRLKTKTIISRPQVLLEKIDPRSFAIAIE